MGPERQDLLFRPWLTINMKLSSMSRAPVQTSVLFYPLHAAGAHVFYKSPGWIRSPKYMHNWSSVCPQSQLFPVHFFVISIMTRYRILNRESSVGKMVLCFVTFRSCRLKFSMEFVVYMSLRISEGYLKYVDNCGQLFLQEAIEDGYLPPHFSSRSSNAPRAISSVSAL